MRLRPTPSTRDAVDFWSGFDIDVMLDKTGTALRGIVPTGLIAFVAVGKKEREHQQKTLQEIGIPPTIWCDCGEDTKIALYELDPELPIGEVVDHFGDGSSVKGPGEIIPLPGTEQCAHLIEQGIGPDDLSVFWTIEPLAVGAEPAPKAPGTLLDPFSVAQDDLGADDLRSLPLLGEVAQSCQATVIYAPPGSGKTLVTLHLLLEAAREGRLVPERTYYINADDSRQGVHDKLVALAEALIRTLVPGLRGFVASQLPELLAQLIEHDQCADVVIIVDTLKKIVDLMDKKQAAAVGDLVRRFVLKGGTFIALAHTRKNEGADGKLVYGGTSDIVEDFDAACLLVPLKERSANDEKLVQFQFRKRRGRNVDETYAYTDDPEASWSEKLASVRLVTDDEASEYEVNAAPDTAIVAAIRAAITAGQVQKMALVREVAATVKASRRDVVACLERHTGPGGHWDFNVQERGAKVYRLLDE